MFNITKGCFPRHLNLFVWEKKGLILFRQPVSQPVFFSSPSFALFSLSPRLFLIHPFFPLSPSLSPILFSFLSPSSLISPPTPPRSRRICPRHGMLVRLKLFIYLLSHLHGGRGLDKRGHGTRAARSWVCN